MTQTKMSNKQVLQVLLAECQEMVEESIYNLLESGEIQQAQAAELMETKIEFILE